MKPYKAVLAVSILGLVAACDDAASDTAETEAAAAEPVDETAALIADALSAAPATITDAATVIDGEGNVLREGSNGWTCIPETPGMGPMCNDAVWMEALGALMAGEPFPTGQFGVSYMLAGEGGAPGVSNLDPAATEPTEDNMWIKDGPHMMLLLPDPAAYDDISNDIAEPVYVMWKDTPYAHLMVRIAEAEAEAE